VCLAGYHVPQMGNSSIATWATMCRHVLEQLKRSTRSATAYLAAACQFLLATAQYREAGEQYPPQEAPEPQERNEEEASASDTRSSRYSRILADDRLFVEDRIAFACTFLPDTEIVDWLHIMKEDCVKNGSIEGILTTGLSDTGLTVLQHYIDRYDDIQTVALLVSRVIDTQQQEPQASVKPCVGVEPRSSTLEWVWLHEYRSLLNRWELFVERAYLDVELGKRYRRKSAMVAATAAKSKDRGPKQVKDMKGKKGPAGVGMGPVHDAVDADASDAGAGADASAFVGGSASRGMYRLPAHSDFLHFFLRCSFCGAALPVDGMENMRPDQLRVQNSVLNCCAACNKQLPRCYVCQLYMVSASAPPFCPQYICDM
jgi:hypothetical protein